MPVKTKKRAAESRAEIITGLTAKEIEDVLFQIAEDSVVLYREFGMLLEWEGEEEPLDDLLNDLQRASKKLKELMSEHGRTITVPALIERLGKQQRKVTFPSRGANGRKAPRGC